MESWVRIADSSDSDRKWDADSADERRLDQKTVFIDARSVQRLSAERAFSLDPVEPHYKRTTD